MSDARTTTLVRKAPRPASDAGRSRLGDLTRPIAKEQRITTNRRPALLLGAVGVVVAGAIGAALFGLPVRTWFGQDAEISHLQEQYDELSHVNTDLQREVDTLQTDAGVVQAVREELGYIRLGEQRETVVGLPDLSTDLPDGWPYGPVEQMINLRAAAAAAPQPSGD